VQVPKVTESVSGAMASTEQLLDVLPEPPVTMVGEAGGGDWIAETLSKSQ